MRRLLWLIVPAAIAALALVPGRDAPSWEGVDETVVGRVAEAAGQHAHGLFAWLQGDLLLFAFLWAGLLAGFVIGYSARALFVERVAAAPGVVGTTARGARDSGHAA